MIRVDYAGPGGTCEGMRMLGLEPVGIEWDAAACATRAAAGHLTIRADLATYRPHHAPGSVEGYWASPPCQTFSTAGKGAGRDQLGRLVQIIDREDWAAANDLDFRTRHVVDAARTAVELNPQWVCMEQVPQGLEAFRAVARRLQSNGFSTWVGVLNAADYGLPQTRQRAVLLASRVRVAAAPQPTHAASAVDSLFGRGLPGWTTMAKALDLGPGRWVLDRRQTGAPTLDPVAVPAPTLTAAALGVGVWALYRDGERVGLSIADGLTVQGFRPDYPVQGTKREAGVQVGNAVPPPLAAHVVAALTGLEVKV